jgi:hypothetical protein
MTEKVPLAQLTALTVVSLGPLLRAAAALSGYGASSKEVRYVRE